MCHGSTPKQSFRDLRRDRRAASMGGNVRVGREDSLWDGPGRLATSNAQQVQRVVAILKSLNLEIATPDETREMLKLKGKHEVAF
jgi:uncharacterized protein (DUF849 family)